MNRFILFILLSAGLFAGVSLAGTIYFDDFSGSSSVNLNGQTPDMTDGTNQWQVLETGYTWKADGSIAVPGGNQNRNALLPFVPEAGNLYTLSLTVNPSNADYFALGFVGTNSLAGSFTSSTDPGAAPWMFIQHDHTLVSRTYYGPGIAGNVGVYPSAEGWGTNVALTITLNTSEADWTVEWFINGESKRTYTYTGGNPSINYVGFGRQGMAAGIVDDFELTMIPWENVIYFDDFSGSSSENLGGLSPDINDGTNVWLSLEIGEPWKADGSIAVPTVSQNRNALLPFTPQSGVIYRLSLTMNPQNDDYFTLGFTGTGSLNGSFTSATDPAAAPWMFIQYDHTLVSRTYYGPGVAGNVGIYPTAEGWGTNVAVSIVLNTVASHWTVEWWINGEQKRTYTYPENPVINNVGFGRQGLGSGTVADFKLTQEGEPEAEILPLYHLDKPDPLADTMWDLDELNQVPVTFPATNFTEEAGAGITPLFYEGEVYTGMTTRVFAWVGIPTNGVGPFPGMVLVHGAGGTAYQEWVQMWMGRGYAAIAMDTAGHIPVHPDGEDTGWVRHDYAGPLGWGGFDQLDEATTDQWGYHAVAAVIRGHSLLRSYPQVDTNRVGITGISWGGVLTCDVAGLDDRFAFASPVYGCGFLGEDSYWLGSNFRPMGETNALIWLNNWDPGRYVGRTKMPMFFVNGTNDKHFRLGSWQKTYRQPETDVTLCCKVRLVHSDIAGRVDEIFTYADSCLKGEIPLPEITNLTRNGSEVLLTYAEGSTVTNAVLNYTTGSGSWTDRYWNVESASLDTSSRQVTATLPAGTSAYYINLVNENGMISSSEHEELTGYEYVSSTPSNVVLSVQSGQVQLGFDLATTARYTIEACTNLVDGSGWTSISSNAVNYWSGPVSVSGGDTGSAGTRYYRVRSAE